MENALKWPVSRTTTWKHLFDVLFVSQTRSVHASIGLCFHTGGLKVIWIGVWTPHEWDQMQYFCMSENLKVIYLRGNQCVRTCSAYIMFDSQYVFILYHSTPYTHMNQKLHTSHIYIPQLYMRSIQYTSIHIYTWLCFHAYHAELLIQLDQHCSHCSVARMTNLMYLVKLFSVCMPKFQGKSRNEL